MLVSTKKNVNPLVNNVVVIALAENLGFNNRLSFNITRPVLKKKLILTLYKSWYVVKDNGNLTNC